MKNCYVAREYLCVFKKNMWVDAITIIEIAKEFVQQVPVKHGDKWKLVTLENLSAHCASEAKEI